MHVDWLAKRARTLMAGACSMALVGGLVPATASAADLNPASVEGARLAERAAFIDSQSGAFGDDSIIVVYREGAAPSKKAQRGMAAQSLRIAGIPNASAEVLSADSGTPGGGAAFHVDLPQGVSVGQAVAAAEADPDVVVAQPNYTYHLIDGGDERFQTANGQPGIDTVSAATANGEADGDSRNGEYPLPDDPLVDVAENDTSQYPSTPNQWWIHAVNAPQAWAQVHGEDNPVTVAVLDTGIDFNHEDLKNNLIADYAYDAYNDEKLTESIDNDEMQHGCHVAGIIAAEANNGLGIAGVTYNGKVLPIRVFHMAYSSYYGYETAQCSDEDLIRAYDYLLSDSDGNGKTVAQETNTRVVNMSLGGYLSDALEAGETEEEAYDYLFEDKIEQAEAAGILTVAAGGNGDSSGNPRTDLSYPSDYPAVMSVIALKTADVRTSWSDHNAMKNISAPGNNIYSTYWTGTPPYRFESGTSMASPLVAGCAALLWSYDSSLTVRDVKDILYGTAADLGAVGFDEYYGWGRVDIGAAVKSLGTATITLDRSTMVRTSRQQLKASEIANRSARHGWVWSVDDESVARVSASGELTAVAAGRATVSVRAQDDDSIVGHRSIEVSEIALPGEVAASANPLQNTISLTWKPAEAAKWYRVMRATAKTGSTDEPGDFTTIATCEAPSADSGEDVSFSDSTVRPSDLYWYRVVPVGELDGAAVDGVAALSNRCFYTEKTALKRAIDEAEQLLDSTETSEDGSDVGEGSYWTGAEAREALNLSLLDAYSAYMSGTMLQQKVDYYCDALEGKITAFKAARVPGSKKEGGSQQAVPAGDRSSESGSSSSPGSSASSAGAGSQASTSASSSTGKVDGADTAGASRPSASESSGKARSSSAAEKTSIAKASVSVAGAVYTGKQLKPRVSVKLAGKALREGTDFTVAYSDNVKVGAGLVTATGTGQYTGSVSKAFAIGKAKNPLAAKGKTVTVAYKKLAKKSQAVVKSKAFKVSKPQGKVTFSKVNGTKSVSVNKKTGKLTVKKGLKKGTYKVKVKVMARGGANYCAGSKTVTVKVKVK